MKKLLRNLLFLMLLLPGFGFAQANPQAVQLPALSAKDYSFGYWENGLRQATPDRLEKVLCFETGYFGFKLNLDDLPQAFFGPLKDNLSYAQAVDAGLERMKQLPVAELNIELSLGSNTYRVVRCGEAKQGKATQLWESGQLAQHYVLRHLVLEDAQGKILACDSKLKVVVWPDSLTLTFDLVPEVEQHADWAKGQVRIALKTQEREWKTAGNLRDAGPKVERYQLSLTCALKVEPENNTALSVHCSMADGQIFPVTFDKTMDCFVSDVNSVKRSWRGGYTDIRDYDDFEIQIENKGTNATLAPFLLDLSRVGNITGLCPMLCDEEGVPTGWPVQLSKNWHYGPMGEYLRTYALIPAPPGKSNYKLRIAYGFYGTLPSATHAQLSLVGYGHHGAGRWDQLAIGCWGETICFDVDMNCVTVAITDVRMLMARRGLKGRVWNWTDAGWGGDWLNVKNTLGEKKLFREMKTAYLAHGPCLSEVKYDGKYGVDNAVDLRNTVRTLRTDDYVRTFQRIRYSFDKNTRIDQGWLFKVGGHGAKATPRIAYGNKAGLIAEQAVPLNLKKGHLMLDALTLSGEGPWWATFPGGESARDRKPAGGSRALIIRSYQSVIGGKTNNAPTVSMPVTQVHKDGRACVDLVVVPPAGTSEFKAGDRVDMDVEWVNVHRVADDYYGPNEVYRKHLQENPRSWKTIYREAVGNDLDVTVQGGELIERYPIVIRAQQPEVRVDIKGGVGLVPIQFKGLPSVRGVKLSQQIDGQWVELDQSVHGNDFWQTQFDPLKKAYTITFNLPLDELASSRWLLTR